MKITAVLFYIVLFYGSGCQSQIINSQQLENQKVISDKSAEYINLPDIQDDKDTIIYKDYKVKKQFKSQTDLVDQAKTVEFAVLFKGNKKVAKFDLLEHPLSVINFGLFSFLGNSEKQIFVSQTAPRLGNHWIISFDPKYRIIFDSSEFNVAAEDFQVIDLNKDGVYELSFANYIRLKLDSQTLAESMPSTEVIFKFDQPSNKYLPANPQFADYLLRDIDEQTKRIRRDDKDAQFADILNIFLKYIYAGKEKEAWDFFDKQYDLEDKETRKNLVKRALETDVIYKTLRKIDDQNKLRQQKFRVP